MAKSPRSQEAAKPQEPAPPQTAATVETPAPPAPPSPPEAANYERKSFVAVFNIVDGAKTYAPGQTATLTRAQFGTLKALGAIEGDWD
jgi:hypothetical protein